MVSHKIHLLFFIFCMTLLSSCSKTYFKRNNWDEQVYERLNQLIADYGVDSKEYDGNCKPYAVFDYDNTTVIGDICLITMQYHIENLLFKIKPEQMFEVLTKDIPNLDTVLNACGGKEVTARMLSEDITDDYKYLYANYINASERSLKKIRKSAEFLDFRAKIWGLSAGIDGTFDYGISCLWVVKLFEGMTYTELSDITENAVKYHENLKGIKRIKWESPDMGKAGKVVVELKSGIKLTDEIKDIYKALINNGFDVYICSASPETIVEAMACSMKYGLNLPKENVFGIRMRGEEIVRAEYDSSYIQPYKAGKTGVIKRFIASKHRNRGPILVAGDSNGDYNMLTDFSDMQVGLLFNCNRHYGGIAELCKEALENKTDSPYVIQGRNDNKVKFVRSGLSEKIK